VKQEERLGQALGIVTGPADQACVLREEEFRESGAEHMSDKLGKSFDWSPCPG